MKKLMLIILLSLVFCWFSGNSASARPDKTGNWNFNETTGLINMPTARVQDYRSMKLSIRMAKLGKNPPLKHRWQTPTPGPLSGTPFDSDWWIDNDGDRRLLISPIRNVEFNLMHFHSQNLKPTVAAKWLCLPETKGFPGIAVGAHNIFGDKEDGQYSKEVRDANSKIAPFIVASKSFGSNDILDLSVGYGGGRFRNRIFYGGQLYVDKGRRFSVLGEYDGNIYSYGVKYRLPKDRWDFGFFMQDRDQPGMTFNYNMPW